MNLTASKHTPLMLNLHMYTLFVLKENILHVNHFLVKYFQVFNSKKKSIFKCGMTSKNFQANHQSQ